MKKKKSKKVLVDVDLPTEIWQELNAIAQKEGITIDALVDRILREELKNKVKRVKKEERRKETKNA